MTDIKKNIRRVFWLFFIMFFVVVAYLGYFAFFASPNIVNTTLNPRVAITRENIQRGYILDRNGHVLAYTQDGVRVYPYGAVFAHVVGHTGVGHAGIEERYNFNLVHLSGELMQRVGNLAFDTPLVGDNLYLTIDVGLQNFVYGRLGQNRGSIVVVQPSTGDVLSMVSFPAYNPNTVAQSWQYLVSDERSPLLNRATQGLYPPGSTFKILTAAAAVEQGMADFVHYCLGSINIGGEIINNFNNVPHGHIDMERAFALSCNTFFVALAYEIGTESFVENMANFFHHVPFALSISQSQFNLSTAGSIGDLMQTSIGQGQTLMTPLYLAMVSSAVANDGVMVAPRVVQYNPLLGFDQRESWQMFDEYTTEILQNIMRQVVVAGTGQPAAVAGVDLAGKTGTAENDAGAAHGWFTGYAKDLDIAIAVILEHSGGTGPVLPIVRDVVTFFRDNNN
ncbi:MAG: penicillin-binding transpeptidase domain-containing protein [Defluviitaleaceae bacterium]|nr:penicillin-binding transpeptidase domain-containing protein [Defluviitaleaceae bacterium]